MKKLVFVLCCILVAISCHKKKLIEVVEVPLPSKADKIEIGTPDDVKASEGAFEINKLFFKYNSFEPNIDALTLENHYGTIYLNFTNNLNKLLVDSEYSNLSIEDLLKKTAQISPDIKNNAGGYYNHTLYFDNLGTKNTIPKDTLAGSINKQFENFENFKTKFTDIAVKQFGSGWAFLIVNAKGELEITTSPNNDNPLMKNQLVSGTPILALDLWEHAYYLKYLNQRKKYIDAYFNIIDWNKVGDKYEETLK